MVRNMKMLSVTGVAALSLIALLFMSGVVWKEPSAVVEDDDNTFIFVNKGLTFAQSQQYCNDHYNSDMASIPNGDVSHRMRVVLNQHHVGQARVGFFFMPNRNTWWVDRTPTGYWEWSGGEPNNAGGNEDCMELKSGGGENDIQCNGGMAFFCNKRPSMSHRTIHKYTNASPSLQEPHTSHWCRRG